MNDYIEREAALDVVKRTGRDPASVWSELANMSADDVAPIRHGRWIDCSNSWMCSKCENDNTFDTPYCLNCGALMDGKKDEHEALYVDIG